MLSSRNRPLAWAFMLSLGLGATLSACQGGEGGAPAGEAPLRDAPYVTVVGQPLLIEDELPGRVLAIRESQVRPQVGGILRERLFEEGDLVEEGQPLYQIDPEVFRADQSMARAALSRANAALKLAETEQERAQQLADSGISTGRELDSANTALDLARADVSSARAALQRSNLNLEYSKVEAPISGRISISRVTEGALVSPADPQPLTTIHQIDEVYVDLKQPLTRYEEIKLLLASEAMTPVENAAIPILSAQGFEYPTKGAFLFTDTAVDPVTSEVTQRVRVPNEDHTLLPGMFVRGRIPQGTVKSAVMVPQQAIRHDATFGSWVYVIDEADAVQMRNVTYGRVVDNQTLVTSGVEIGDRVVVEGHSQLRPNATVNPVEWQSSTAPQQP